MERAPFKNILEGATRSEFFSLRQFKLYHEGDRFPTVQEATAHLLLLKAFDRLYSKVTSHIREEKDKVIPWKVYVTNAVRRFIIFLNALKSSRKLDSLYRPFDGDFGDHPETVLNLLPDDDFQYFKKVENRIPNALPGLLPPLDVVLVWHAFLLNPKSFYDNCIRNGLQDFALTSFPLDKIAGAIDWDTFEYCPDEKQRLGFHELMKNAGVVVEYEVDLKHLVTEKVCVFCPICFKLLSTVPYTDALGHGFADKDFIAEFSRKECACYCEGFRGTILSHDNLRKRQLVADVYVEKKRLPCIYRYYSSVLKGEPNDEMHINRIDYLVKKYLRESVVTKIVQDKDSPLDNALRKLARGSATSKSQKRIILNTKYILRNYPQMNLIHATIPPMKHNVKISEDLVGCVLRQQKFVDKMNKIGWLFSPVLKETLLETSIRYTRFISMLITTDGILVPTLDIDLMWHTHLLSPFFYLDYCRKNGKNVVDHDDKIEEGKLTTRFEETSKIYKTRYGKEYSLCFCWFCVSARNNCRSKIKRLFKSKGDLEENTKRNILTDENAITEDKGAGLTHISSHNAITIPRGNNLVSVRMKRNYGKNDNGKIYPWRDDIYYYHSSSGMYVLPYNSPIPAVESDYWGSDGGCCAVSNHGGASCSGGANCGSNTAACGKSGGACGGWGGGGGGCGGGGGGCGGGGGGCGGGGGGCGGGGGGGGGGC
ncbi:hypothetical protein CLIB1423_11S03510 [[Candida] railenensis]|uniref:Uncharacterized protein n=1 Tax=[Candida] railenensis TaxID=45579 RepID=A0A9P0VZ51_9ASCO|nr:hypothetical protein CLIB1423_11S03510 [[Candida] railenensis]